MRSTSDGRLMRKALMPYAPASLTKSGLPSRSTPERRLSKNSSCHWRTMPRYALLMMRIFTGSLCSAAVAAHGPHLRLRPRELRADGRGQAEAHRPGAARRDPVTVLGREAELRGPHLVLADVRRDDRLAAAQLVEA